MRSDLSASTQTALLAQRATAVPEVQRITRQLKGIAETIRALYALDPDDYEGREPLWIEHFNLLAELEALA